MQQVGGTFLFDYGELLLRVRYLSERRLQWEQVQGPEPGLKAEEDYTFVTVRPDVYFLWWQEKDTSTVTQVVDFAKGVVYTTWITPEKQLMAFQGKVTRQE